LANEYINNRIFEATILRFKEAEKNKQENLEEYVEAQQELSKLFYILAENLIRAYKFQLIEKEDALQEGVMICFEKLDKFKPELGKAFNYYTTCTLNHFRQLYRNAKGYSEFRQRYQNHMMEEAQQAFNASSNNRTKKKHNFYPKDQEN
jgi:DNA-directed RNA polymerase specialized sigma24 family protein